MFLGGQRIDGIPGNWVLCFDPAGSVEGTGHDVWGQFTLFGSWTSTGLVLLRKQCSSRHRSYYVDLFGFLCPRGGLHGLWHFQGGTGGFWAWQGEHRELPVAAPTFF